MENIGSVINLLTSAVLLDKPRMLRFENLMIMKGFVAKEITNYRNPYPYLEGLILGVTRRVTMVEMNERERADTNSTGFTFI